MQLTELLFQKVRELGAQGNVALRPGYCALVGKSRQLRRALVAALFPNPSDLKLLSDGGPNPRVGVGLLGADGQPYRLLRELGGGRQLQRFDAAQRKFLPLTEDDLEIASFLRTEAQLPTPETYDVFFVLDAAELPSQRKSGNTPAGGVAAVDQEKVRRLKASCSRPRSSRRRRTGSTRCSSGCTSSPRSPASSTWPSKRWPRSRRKRAARSSRRPRRAT